MDNIFLVNEVIDKFRFRKVINAIKFSHFYHQKRKPVSLIRVLRQFFWIGKSLFTLRISSDLRFVEQSKYKGINGAVSYVTINTTDAVHYKKIESKLVRLIEDELRSRECSIKHIQLDKSKPTYSLSWITQMKLNCYAFYILIALVLRAVFFRRTEARELVLNNLDYLFTHIVKYLVEHRYFSAFFRSNRPAFVLTINENWMPQSVVIDCSKKYGVPTVIYPHGIIGDVNLPFECDIVLFWNQRMKGCYEQFTRNRDKNFVIGAVEPLFEEEYANVFAPEYDVLIISQLMVANDKENIIFKDIFRVWMAYMEQHPSFTVCIKLHPFEGPKEIAFLESLFGKDNSRVTVVQGSHIPVSQLIIRSKRVSTVSSSSIQHCFYLKRPVLLYAPTDQLIKNFPIPENWSFKDLKGLTRILAADEEPALVPGMDEGYFKWAKEDEVKKNIKCFVDRCF